MQVNKQLHSAFTPNVPESQFQELPSSLKETQKVPTHLAFCRSEYKCAMVLIYGATEIHTVKFLNFGIRKAKALLY